MTWHVIRVRSKDAQKQLARTSLTRLSSDFYLLKNYICLQGDAVLVAGYQDLAIQFPLFSIFH